MMMSSVSICVFLCCVVGLYGRAHQQDNQLSHLNFVGSRYEKWRHEVRVAQNGILALEYTIPGHGQSDLFLRLASDGNHVVKLIYSDMDTIETCDVEKNNAEAVQDFLSKFVGKKEIHSQDIKMENLFEILGAGGNFTSQKIHPHTKLSGQYHDMIQLHHLMKLCKLNYKAKKNILQANKKTKGLKQKRTKRELIYPGTKWCGKGTKAQHYHELGESRDEDKCCREHDYCKYMIEGLSSGWNYFNHRLTTISHCDCDDSFMTCLKYLNTEPADMIGELYFNIAETECFVFKEVRQCAKRSMWGRCRDWEYVLNVDVKEPFPYVR